ncbi:carbohydrate kinase [Microbacterium sp. B2969]|uniref:Carbohydrate kinase n=1 Tax=Microbacterium alkaliflavum TaxID=3248839 RepID=A0ABW7QDX9_9MICO
MLEAIHEPDGEEGAPVLAGASRVPQTPVDVLVIGEALMDITSHAGGMSEMPGGGPANVALGLGRRGVDVALLTNLGRDSRGSTITRHLEHSGVWVLAESYVADPTSTALARIADDGSASYEFDVRWAATSRSLHVRPRTVHTGSLAAFMGPGSALVLAHLDRLNPEIVTFDPNIRPALIGEPDRVRSRFEDFARRATVVKLSDEDAEYLYPQVDLTVVLDAISRLGPRLVAVTRGAKGAVLSADEHIVHVPGRAVPVVDTIGAGDTFMASLIAGYSALHPGELSEIVLSRLGERAVDAASITVGRAGADLPWTRELQPMA